MLSSAGTAAQEFAQLRQHFHAMVELGIEARHAALEPLDEPIRSQLSSLFEHLDQNDLDAAPGPDDAPDPEARAGGHAGERLGAYCLIECIGRGGMGEVWRAQRADGAYRGQLAVKLLRRGLLDPGAVRRFLRERQILARLTHPGIAPLMDGGVAADGTPWLAMPLLEGQPITDWAFARALNVAARVGLFLKLLEAVDHAHGRKVVHRDIKPGNVLVDTDGHPMLLDFGIAQWLDDDRAQATRAVAMTARYASPEQISGETCTPASDVYALGLLLFELLTGSSPFPLAEAGTISFTHAQLHSQPASLIAQWSPRTRLAESQLRHLRGDLALIAAKCLAKAPDARYPDARALAHDLGDWLARQPLRSGISRPWTRSRLWLLRHRYWVGASAAVLIALGSGVVLALHQAGQAALEAERARRHLTALIDVLASANPSAFAASAPLATDLLVQAAQRLKRQFPDDAELLARSLGEIGHALLNAARWQEASVELHAAYQALRRLPDVDPLRELQLLKLILFVSSDSSEGPADGQPLSLQASAARVRTLASLMHEQEHIRRDVALNVLAVAARQLRAAGDTAAAESTMSQLRAMLAADIPMQASAEEDLRRQLGKYAERSGNWLEAEGEYRRGLAVIEKHPEAFSEMRSAEAWFNLAESQKQLMQPHRALESWRQAAPAYRKHYAQTHPERVTFEALGVQLGAMTKP